MIIKEFHSQREDGVKLYRTYSSEGHMIRQEQTGFIYAEAIDIEGLEFTYTEVVENGNSNTN